MKPKPNYEVNDYIEFTAEAESFLIYEPPFTKDHSDDELRKYIDAKLNIEVCNNSVLTERIIRDMADVQKREAMIHSIRQQWQKASSD